MDNLRVHHNADVKNKIIEKGLEIKYNLPYSPELNPIEEVFSVIKRNIRHDCIHGLEALIEYMPRLIERLNNTLNFENFYRHAFE